MATRNFPWDQEMSILRSPEAFMSYAAAVAPLLKPGDVLALCGNLGAGKTHFAKGLVSGLGCSQPVTSPTFSLVQEYLDGPIPVFHFDFYRTKHPQEILELGWDDYLDRRGICVVEWADLFPQVFPQHTHWIQIDVLSAESRRISPRSSGD